MKEIFTLLVTVMLVLSALLVNVKPATAQLENSWASKASMQQARSGLGVAALNGKIYAIGGTTESKFVPSTPASAILGDRDLGGFVGTNEEYDPATDTWTYKAPMPTPRILFATAVYQNKIYCIGGKTSFGYIGVNEVYDTATNTWESKAQLPEGLGWATANVIDSKIHVIGGYGKHYVYDINSNSWTTKEPLPYSQYVGFTSATLKGKIYVVGGASEDSHYNLMQIYDARLDQWTYGSNSPSSVGGGSTVAMTGTLSQDRIFVFGQPASLRQFEPRNFTRIYDPENDSWSLGANPLQGKPFHFGVAAMNGTFYMIGGFTYNGLEFKPLNITQQYTPPNYGLDNAELPTSMNTPEQKTENISTVLIVAIATDIAIVSVIGFGLIQHMKSRGKHRTRSKVDCVIV